MAEKEFESDDPMELVGMVLGDAEGGMDDMARVFVEEYLRMGWPPEEILGLFDDPFYRGPHAVLRSKGPAYVRDLVTRLAAGD